ncbi:MAG: metallopeptidase TldD-related protein, partial [Dyadobacter sp.]
MGILSQQEAKKNIDKVLSFSKADEMSVSLSGENVGNIRYARNSVSTSGDSRNVSLAVTAVFGKRTGTATINEFDEESIKKTVARAEELAKLAPENPEYVSMLGPQKYPETKSYSDNTANIDPDKRAQIALDSIDLCRKKSVVAAGYLEDSAGFRAIGNSKGLFGYYKTTSVDYSITVRTEDAKGSGYVVRDFNDVSKLNSASLTQTALQKAMASTAAQAIEPGRYTVILEPTAAAELMRNMMSNMDARSADEGRSFLSKKGGGNRLGEKLFDERITIYSDPMDIDIPGYPFVIGDNTVDGRAQEKVVWIEKGVVKNMFYSRFWAEKKGVKAIA